VFDGCNDLTARLVMGKLRERCGVPVVIDKRAGGTLFNSYTS